ncbi:hypothetical protein AAG570_009863 [Ranatra chinensis]|uniref:OB domain-containing protein n=1 Tax=Ranatra chinensis TaxID=642074 RepID=A0ABD0YQW4_9HEMI
MGLPLLQKYGPYCSGSQIAVQVAEMASPEILPLARIRPYENWTVKARVVHKSEIFPARDGNMFFAYLADASGEIESLAFRKVADQFYDVIQGNPTEHSPYCVLIVHGQD